MFNEIELGYFIVKLLSQFIMAIATTLENRLYMEAQKDI